MNELGGFIVLSGSLFPLLIWFFVSIIVARLLSRLFKPGAVRLFGGIGLFVLIFVFPLADEVVGKAYFRYLCNARVGEKVYHTATLPGQLWDEQGRAQYLATNGYVDMSKLPSKYEWRSIDEPYIDTIIRISKRRWQLVDATTQTVLGERISYMRYFGWLNRFSPAPNVGETCPLQKEEKRKEQEQNFFAEIFKPEPTIQ